MMTAGLVLLCIFALVGVFAVFGAIRQWWINPSRKFDRDMRRFQKEQERREKLKG